MYIVANRSPSSYQNQIDPEPWQMTLNLTSHLPLILISIWSQSTLDQNKAF